MKLGKLLDIPGLPSVQVSRLIGDSKKVVPGDLFVASSGDPSSRDFHISEAERLGAVAVLTTNTQIKSSKIPIIENADLVANRGELASLFYGDPSKKKICVGVTGTNGKTSIAYNVAAIGEMLEFEFGYIGTLGFGKLGKLSYGSLTTPDALDIQRIMSELNDQDLAGFSIEVSSHALSQNRVKQIHFDTAVFSNLSRDHLDYHKDMKSYGLAKKKLFTEWSLRSAVVNLDDDFGKRVAKQVNTDRLITYGKCGDLSWHHQNIEKGMQVEFSIAGKSIDVELPVSSDFEVANIAAALAVFITMGYPLGRFSNLLPRLPSIPGRMQRMQGPKGYPSVILDYAHTPDALKRLLAALRHHEESKLICVVGCGGGRDVGKRPIMGRIAIENSEFCYFTSDNPRDEDPEEILKAMTASISNSEKRRTKCVVDRRQAIREAIEFANEIDIVVIAGKGHETTQEISGRRLPLSDAEIISEIFGT
jgi:UDP-N-acetylmuramoyl-L-alanyl-D-glutamate--2,6-diaminopimelate ligase